MGLSFVYVKNVCRFLPKLDSRYFFTALCFFPCLEVVLSLVNCLLFSNWNLSLILSFVHVKNICILFNDLAAIFYFYFFLIWAHNSDTNTDHMKKTIKILTYKNGNPEKESKHASRKEIDAMPSIFHILKYTCFFIEHVIYTCTFSFGICEQKLINIFLIV